MITAHYLMVIDSGKRRTHDMSILFPYISEYPTYTYMTYTGEQHSRNTDKYLLVDICNDKRSEKLKCQEKRYDGESGAAFPC